MDLIEKYLYEVIRNQPIPKNIMGYGVILKKKIKSDINIIYQLFKEKNGGSGFVRQYDIDGDESIETRRFPKFEDAEKYYNKLIKLM